MVLEDSDWLSAEAEQMIERLYQKMIEYDGLNVSDVPVTDTAMEIQFFLFDSIHTVSTLFGQHSPEVETIRSAHRWVKKNAEAFNATYPAPPAEWRKLE